MGGAVILVLAGCTEREESSDALSSQYSGGFSQRDSAGVLIAVTQAEIAQRPLGWTVDSVPSLVIGANNTPEEALYSVEGVTQLENGDLLVVDGGSAELRFFDADGDFAEAVGGKGEGPGEFVSPRLVPARRRDSLIVYDLGTRRLHLVSPESRAMRIVDQEVPRSHPEGNLLSAQAPRIEGAVRSAALLASDVSPRRPTQSGVGYRSLEYSWLDFMTQQTTPLLSVDIPRSWITIEEGRPPYSAVIPFTMRWVPATVSPGGALFSVGSAPEIREYGLDGDLRRVIRIDMEGRPVDAEMLEAAAAHSGATLPASEIYYANLYAEMSLPDTLPAFWSLVMDDRGWTWAEVFQPEYAREGDAPRTWVVFDSDGRARGTVETPARLEVVEIREDYILGIWTSELDVEQVRRYSLRREESQQ